PPAAAVDPAPPAQSLAPIRAPLAKTAVAASAAAAPAAATPAVAPPVPAAAPAASVAAPAPAAPAPAVAASLPPRPPSPAPAEPSSMSMVKLFFIFTFIASSLALVGFFGRGLIDYVIARRNNRRAAERAHTQAPWPAWTASPPPPMPYMHAPHLADDFEPTPERPVRDRPIVSPGDWSGTATQSATRGRVA